MLHSCRTKVQWVKQRKYLTQRSNVANTRATTCFFYIPNISTNKRYENLAASIGSTNETLNQSYSNDFDSSEGPTFLGCFKLPVPLMVRRPQTITCAAVKIQTNLSGRLETHQRGFWIEILFIMPRRPII